MIHKKVGPPYYTITQPVRVCQGTIKQMGTNDPVLNKLVDEIVGVTIVRNTTGRYSISWESFMDTVNTISVTTSVKGVTTNCKDAGTGVLLIETWDIDGNYTDDGMDNGWFEITARQLND